MILPKFSTRSKGSEFTMKFSIIIDLMGQLLVFFASALGVCALFSWIEIYRHPDVGPLETPALYSFLVAAGISLVLGVGARFSAGFPTSKKKRFLTQVAWKLRGIEPKGEVKPSDIGRREAILMVVGCYFIGSLIAAIPFAGWSILCGQPQSVMFQGFANPWFEAMSGITTCGATILSDIEALPRSILLWRAFIQWLGGLGFVVLFVAFLPTLGVGGKKLFLAESTGPTPKGLRPHVAETGWTLIYFYLVLTCMAATLLMGCGMDWFDAVCHSFTTVSTAGFSTKNASIAAFNSFSIELVVMSFMLASGVAFSIYYLWIKAVLNKRRFNPLSYSPELRLYLLLGFLVTVVCAISLIVTRHDILLTTGEVVEPSYLNSLRYSAFAAISILTTTGYTAAAYETWPALAVVALMAIYLVGGMAGSTSGGMKIIRVWIAGKLMISGIEKIYEPKVVRPIKVGSSMVPSETRTMVLVFVLFTFLLICIGSALLETFEGTNGIDFTTSLSAAASAVANVGPGLSRVGADDTYAFLSMPSKLTLTFLMMMGRVELLMVLALFTRRFWSRV